ncbi:MAG: hypothetical protein ACFFC3_12750 [Candidatus Odinarchaeota archaeon]
MKSYSKNQIVTKTKEKINLDKVALIGRTFDEYERIFRLNDFRLKNITILDVGSGVSSFCAEASNRGIKVTAMDPIYDYNSSSLELKCSKDLDLIIEELNGVEYLYIWEIFRSKNDLKKHREKAYKEFIKHYRDNKGGLYISEKMPKTIFKSNQFDIIISSHLLFLYDHIFDYNFHKNTIKEMLRICSKEVRIFPLVNLYGKRSPFLSRILDDDNFLDYKKSIEKVKYQFIRGGNEFLRMIKN